MKCKHCSVELPEDFGDETCLRCEKLRFDAQIEQYENIMYEDLMENGVF